jgi:hypothetical protein
MVQFVLGDVRVELGQLVIVLSGFSVILHVEVAVSKKREGSATARLELQLIV